MKKEAIGLLLMSLMTAIYFWPRKQPGTNEFLFNGGDTSDFHYTAPPPEKTTLELIYVGSGSPEAPNNYLPPPATIARQIIDASNDRPIRVYMQLAQEPALCPVRVR
jgi:hypothetical protein